MKTRRRWSFFISSACGVYQHFKINSGLFLTVLPYSFNVKPRNEQHLSDHSPKQLISNISSRAVPFKGRRSGILQRFGNGAALIVASNLLTLFLFAVTKKLRKRCLFFVFNMAFADLMIGALSLPSYIYFYVGNQFMLWEAKVDLSLDIFFVVVEVIFSQASLISAASISFERLYAVYWPLKHRTLSIRVYRIAIFIVWTVAAIISVLVNLSYYVTSHKLAIYFWISYTFTLLFILSGCNIAIWRKVQGRSNPASHLQNRAIQN